MDIATPPARVDALLRRLPPWARRALKTPLATCRVWLLFLTDYKKLFTEALSGSWPYRVHPITFFSLCFALWVSALSLDKQQVGWYEVLEACPECSLMFIEYFPKVDLFSDETARDESLQPGSSKASADIRKIAHSDSAVAVSAYLAGKDPKLAATFDEKRVIVEKHDQIWQWFNRSLWALACFLFLVVVIPVHFVLHAPARTLRDTLYVALYIYGFWWPVHAAIEVALHFAFSSGFPSNYWMIGALYIVMAAILILIPVTWWRTLRFTHNASNARIFGSLVTVVGMLFLVTYLATETVVWLKIPMPEWNTFRRY